MSEQREAFAAQRERMVTEQIEGRGIHDPAILQAMRSVQRELFVADTYQIYAYDDTPLPIPNQQTISQPYVVALMIRALRLTPDANVLEIGTGSGYAAALLAQIAREVHSVERHRKLVSYARQRLTMLGYENVFVHFGDGTLGWPQNAPYDAIMVSAGGPDVPHSLKSQMVVGGRLVMPIGASERRQHLICLTRESETGYRRTDLGAVAFVPLIGEEGW
ncbi:MAG: protein-L-isoaspartate(D-aspartate) O-methyltransferase [Candidatus Promineifilaceae bacterium]|nr:protein-L-isoaspartate(D-aspartate) O-methyltransferase [Candidatus Promineifilaceae bacterium]